MKRAQITHEWDSVAPYNERWLVAFVATAANVIGVIDPSVLVSPAKSAPERLFTDFPECRSLKLSYS